MTLGRVIGLLVLVVVLYSVVTQPSESAAMTRTGAGHLADAGTSLTTFLSELTAGGSSTDGSTSTSTDDTSSDSDGPDEQVLPRGGVDTGDGSTR